MQGTQNYIIECSRINSLGAQNDEDFDNKSSWTNKISPILLKKGDNLSLQNVMINVAGADSTAIYFQGAETKPQSNIQDNFSLMKIGFYKNHNGVDTSAMPIKFETSSTPADYEYLQTDDNKTTNSLINNDYGSLHDYEYFDGDGALPDTQRISRIDAVESCNPNFIMDGRKFARIDPAYNGWMRPTDENAYQGLGVEPKLLTQEIPILLDQGFINPQSIADQITLTMNQTNKLYTEDRFQPTANIYKQDDESNPNKRNVKMYNFNGYSFKTTTCNLYKYQDYQHHIYSNIAVDEPYLWKYGINIVSNAEVDNLQGNEYIKTGLSNYQNLRIDYPVIIWNRFIGDDPDEFTIGDEDQYLIYSPSKWGLASSGSTSMLTIENFSTTNYSEFNQVYPNVISDQDNGAMLYYTTQNSFKIVRSHTLGTNILKPALFCNNSLSRESLILGYSRFPKLTGTWYVTEHQIFQTTEDINYYEYVGANAEFFFQFLVPEYSTIRLYEDTAGIGSGDKIIQKLLTLDSGGIKKGSTYTITFTLNWESGGDANNFSRTIFVQGQNIGLDRHEYTSQGDKTITFVATDDNITSNAIQFGIVATNVGGFSVRMDDVSILRTGMGTDEPYNCSNTWTSNYTNGEDNKFFILDKIYDNVLINLTIANSTAPTQPPLYSNVDFNKTYDFCAKGLVLDYQNGEYLFSDDLGGRNENLSIFYYQDTNNDYTYWVFQKRSDLANWYMVRTELYNGTTPANGVLIGGQTSEEVELKNQFRNGQQFYDFENSNWTYESNFVNFDINDISWESNELDSFFVALENVGDNYGITIDGQIFIFDWTIEPVPVDGVLLDDSYYLQVNNETGTAGTWKNESGHYGTWAYSDVLGIILTATVGDDITFFSPEAPELTDVLTLPIQITNQNLNNPNGLPWNDARKYYFSFRRYLGAETYKTYYITLLPDGSEDDDSLNGWKGTVYTASGASNEGTWNLDINTFTWTSGIANDPVTLNTTAKPILTDEVTYSVNNTITSANLTYLIPLDGKQYGDDFNDYGTTSYTDTTIPAMYCGFNTNTDHNDLLSIEEGFLYDDKDDVFANNNGKKWSIVQEGNNYTFTITRISDDVEIMKISAPRTQLNFSGWTLFKSNKIPSGELLTNDATIYNVSLDAWAGSFSEPIDNDLQSIETNGETGKNVQLLADASGANVLDSGLFKNYQNRDFTEYESYIEKHQLLITNIKYTQANLEMFKNFFRYNEVYEGSKTNRTDILKDVEYFQVEMDLGRGSDIPDIINTSDSSNTTGQTPLQPYYMYDSGKISTSSKTGCMNPMNKLNGNEQRIQVFTRWNDNYESRYKADGLLNFAHCYADGISTQEFKNQYPDLYEYVSTNNVGCIPVKAKDGTLRIALETYKDYTNGELFRIQNFTYFVYSPSFVDHDYITMWNLDAPSKKANDYNYTDHREDQCNYQNIGANQPVLDYNEQFGKFSWKYWHTPVYFNKVTGTDANLGQEIARIFDNAQNIIFRDFPTGYSKGAFDNRIHIGINDSQAGIYLIDCYHKNVDDSSMTSSTDSRAVLMTSDNFYNCLWFRLGFTYFNLKPIKFSKKSFHDNRFSNRSYNNTISNQSDGLTPFTTNSLVNINDMLGLNVYSQNSGKVDTENANVGTPIYGLGYNNGLTVAIQTESDVMYSKSLPVNITSGFFRIYTDLPTDTLQYTASTNLNCIGIGLLNYASSGQFFFSYAMDYGVSITRDVSISSVKIEVRDERGAIVKGLGDRSTVILKVTRDITIGPPVEDPEIEELKKIEGELKDEDLDIRNIRGDGEMEKGKEALKGGDFENENLSRIYKNLMTSYFREIISETEIQRGDTRTDIVDRIYRNLREGIDERLITNIREAVRTRNFRRLDELVQSRFGNDINISSTGRIIDARIPPHVDFVVNPETAFNLFQNRGRITRDDINNAYGPQGNIRLHRNVTASPRSNIYTSERRFIEANIMNRVRPYLDMFDTTQAQRRDIDRLANRYIQRARQNYNQGDIRGFRENLSRYINRIRDIVGNTRNLPDLQRYVRLLGPVKTKVQPQGQVESKSSEPDAQAQGGAIKNEKSA